MVIAAPLPQPREEIRSAEAVEPRRRGTWPWLWPSVLTLGLTSHGLTVPLLSRDELVTWDVVNRDTGQILATVQNVDAVHGTYYLLMHLWVSLFGDSVISLRLPSVCAVAGAASVTSLIGNRLFGRRAGIVAGTLFALVPAVSRYGQEARSYALVILMVALATLLLLRALDNPRSPWRWAAYVLTLTGVGLLHLIALSVVLAHACVLAAHARHDRSVWWKSGLTLLAVAACVAPLTLLGRSQAHRQLYWVPEPDVWALSSIWPDVFASAVCSGALIALACLARSPRKAPVLLCAAWAVLPSVVVWLASHGDVSYWRQVYILFTLPAWALLAGAGLAATFHSRRATAALLAALAVLTLPDQKRMREPFEHNVPVPLDYAAAADIVTRYHQPGDAIVYDRQDTWKLDSGVQYYLPRDLKLRDVFLVKTPTAINDLYAIQCPVPELCLKSAQRIWLMAQGAGPDPFDSIAPDQASALRTRYRASMSASVTGMTVTLLVRKERS
ncbi:glycosyltransferase family 39 protein [Streptomyces chiangmaiensis]|uniref:Glycosyltransferase family 39 protein n=1 Tax=Streptomyces chiangmaiensis TaxID=766497 RepID=A0ABU7FQF4_9ACTN|nr:glycosyltransferase family 39 protein [Streptomyces chiangmaiensis]MED7826322.1 glycosyltransferase family 39 protein [Streptomyces chiangmaiensis]